MFFGDLKSVHSDRKGSIDNNAQTCALPSKATFLLLHFIHIKLMGKGMSLPLKQSISILGGNFTCATSYDVQSHIDASLGHFP